MLITVICVTLFLLALFWISETETNREQREQIATWIICGLGCAALVAWYFGSGFIR